MRLRNRMGVSSARAAMAAALEDQKRVSEGLVEKAKTSVKALATQQQINKQVAGIGASYREWCRRATRPFRRHALRVVKFEDVGGDR